MFDKKYVLTLTIAFLFVIKVNGQFGNDIWYFGEHAGINFNTASPTALTNSSMQAWDNTSTITDANSNLIFYTNGVQSWDKNHNQMPNGNNLGGTLSSGQSALIVPQPNSTKYYIFTVGYASGDAFRYSIVDMSLNGGNGDVISKANALLSGGSTEKIDAIYNPLDTSFWVMTHAWNSNSYYCYKINSQGLQSNPVVSSIGFMMSGGNPVGYNAVGQMSFSKDGTKLASAIYDIGHIEIFDFNMATGQLSNAVILNGFFRPWGIAFSINNHFLYYTEWYDDKAIQMDITSGVPATIVASKVTVGTATFAGPTMSGYKIGYMEYGPDSILYIAKFDQHYISAIIHPNLAGTNCAFVDNGVYLGSKTCDAGLSRVATYYYPQASPCSNDYYDTIHLCAGDSTLIDGNFYKAPNAVVDSLVGFDGCDSIIHYDLIQLPLPTISLGSDTSFCDGDSVLVSATGNYTSILWNNGNTMSNLYISVAGSYWATVSDANCSNSDTISVINLSNNYVHINDTTICEGDIWQINLPSQYQYQWFDGSSLPYIEIFDSGYYYVKITDICKSYTDSFLLVTEDCNCRIFVPNVFTPNGDGLNETFFPVISCELDEYHLYIFNRWGNLLYETSDQWAVWDGKYKGNKVPDGVYFYLIEYLHLRTAAKKNEKRGTVTVLR